MSEEELEEEEDAEDLRIALERLASPGRRWTLEDIERGRDLENDDLSPTQG